MTHWAFCENMESDTVLISGAEAHHLLHVLRVSAGSTLTCFDGRGTEAEAVVSLVSRSDVTCRVESRRLVPRPTRPTVTVAVSPPKGDRLRWMVEKLTEIGVDRLVLLNTSRTIVTPGETRVDKLRANIIAACKQCRRSRLIELLPMQPFPVFLESTIRTGSTQLIIAHPGIDSGERVQLEMRDSRDSTLLIGPEGGFTDDEVQSARNAGAVAMSWPETTLRIETAAIVFATLLLAASVHKAQPADVQL